jgi:hypothetical protein
MEQTASFSVLIFGNILAFSLRGATPYRIAAVD